MAAIFLDTFNLIAKSQGLNDGNNTNTTRHTCVSAIDHYKFHQFALIPAILISLSFAVTKQRRNILLSILSGRPGLVFPMDSLTRSSTLSYGCAFGATAFLVYKIVLYQQYAIDYQGATALKSFIALASMFIYGMVFYPLFASLAIGSVFGYGLGALYVWMMTGIEIYRVFECDTDLNGRLFLIFRNLPSILCLVYLSVSIPCRMVLAARQRRFFMWKADVQETNTLDDIRASYAGHHVIQLLQKPVVVRPPQGAKAKIKRLVLGLIHRLIYQKKKGFRYPTRIVSVMVVALLVVYTLTYEFLTLIPAIVQAYQNGILMAIELAEGEDKAITTYRESLYIAWWFLNTARICIIVSCALASVFSLINILHTLSSYRMNLLSLYKGDHSRIPPASNTSNTSHCVNSIKYGGYQVGYIIWGYIIQFVILFIVCYALSIAVILIASDVTGWLLWLLNILWPIVLTALVIAVGQILLARFVFLQARGAYLALDNRSWYFNFTYFMFFYNIFLGLVSCLLRILKAMVIGIFFLSRLDNSTLNRRFEFLDPGFKAYVGYMQMEYAHTHPVLIVFTRLMYLALHNKRQREAEKRIVNGGSNKVMSVDDVKIEMTAAEDEAKRIRSLVARFNWHVTFTLLHNPEIRVMRKGYLQMLRQARLLGVHIPVSDRQADVNFDKLQSDIQQAREELAAGGKKKGKADAVEEKKKLVVTGSDFNEEVGAFSGPAGAKNDDDVMYDGGRVDGTQVQVPRTVTHL